MVSSRKSLKLPAVITTGFVDNAAALTEVGMSKPNSPKQGIGRAPLAARWKGGDSLDFVYQFNERALGLLSGVAMSSIPDDFAAIAPYRDQWSGLDAEIIRRAARFPFVILDVHFTNETWWQRVIQLKTASTVAPIPCRWPTKVAEPLMQEMMIFAWHSVKSDRRVAWLLLGMSSAVANVIADLSPEQLTQIARSHSSELRLRWQDNADFWSQLLRTARNGDQNALEEIRLHAKLLLCGELISDD
jgi:hypothetical protein